MKNVRDFSRILDRTTARFITVVYLVHVLCPLYSDPPCLDILYVWMAPYSLPVNRVPAMPRCITFPRRVAHRVTYSVPACTRSGRAVGRAPRRITLGNVIIICERSKVH